MEYVLGFVGVCALAVFGLSRNVRKPWRCDMPPCYDRPYEGSNKFLVVSWSRLWMGDWDLKEGPDDNRWSHTVSSREEALARLEAWCASRPGDRFRVYETPGGVRAFLVSRPLPVGGEAEAMHDALGVDPLYRDFTREKRGFCCRVSPKEGRQGDYVARFWCEVGGGACDPSLAGYVTYHDALVGMFNS